MTYKTISYYTIVIVLLSSCSTTLPQSYFIPHEANTLRLQEKKELKVSGGLMVNDNTHFIINPTTFEERTIKSFQAISSFQIAYSPIKHLGVFGIHHRVKLKDPENSSINFHKSNLTGGGIGTYFSFRLKQRPSKKIKLGKTQKYNNFILDLYGGYAFGKLENHYNLPVGDTKMEFEKYYLQSGIHWEAGKWCSALVYKFGYTNYSDISILGKPDNLNDSALQTILKNTSTPFHEFTIKLDYRIKSILLYSQATISHIEKFNYQGMVMPLFHGGVIIDIHQFIKKKN